MKHTLRLIFGGLLILANIHVVFASTFEGSINFEVREDHHPYWDSEGDPAIFIFLKTSRIYGCCNFNIRSQVAINSNDVVVKIVNIEEPSVCLTVLGPATARHWLGIPPGQYNLRFEHGASADSYSMVVTNSEITVHGNNGAFASPSTRMYQRYPQRSFVFLCGTTTETSGSCEEFYKTLLNAGSFKEYSFPQEANLPYPRKSDGYCYNMPAKYFTYEHEADYTKAGELLRKFKLDVIKDKMGIGLELSNWRNKRYQSWIIEK